MKGLTSFTCMAMLAVAPIAVQAELKPVSDDLLSEMTGQSGLLIEIGAGTADTSDITTVDWSQAGVTIEATKWIWDMETYDSDSNVHSDTPSSYLGGIINQGVKVAGSVDVLVDGVTDNNTGRSAISITFENSRLHTRTDSTSVFLNDGTIGPSMGATETIGLVLDGAQLAISGR